jgi:hypothetical protein
MVSGTLPLWWKQGTRIVDHVEHNGSNVQTCSCDVSAHVDQSFHQGNAGLT